MLTLTTPGACTWTATSTAGWITFPAASGTSAASIAYAVAANPGADRSETMTLGGQPVTVLQRAVCTYSYTPLSATVSATAGVSTLAVTSSAPTCAWTAGTPTPWLTLTAAGGYAGQVFADRPLAYWRLGAVSATGTVADAIAGHDGAIVGNVLQVPGLVAGSDTALQVDTGAYVEVGAKTPLLYPAGAVECWAAPSAKGPLVVQSNGPHWENQVLAVYAEGPDAKYHVAFADGTRAQYDIVSASDIAFHVPTHVVVTWGAGAWAISLNGVRDATGAQTVVPASGGSLRFGYGPGLTYGYGHGVIDDVAMYDHPLSAAAVAAHYAARTSLPLLGSGVIAYRRDMNPTLTARTGRMLIEDDVVPITQSGLAPRLDLDGIVAPTTATVTPGQTIHARVQDGPGNLRDWVGLYAAGSDDASGPLAWMYLSGTTDAPPVGLTTATVALPMPTTPGTYEVRFFWNDALLKLATSGPVMVGGPTVTLTSPAANATVGAGETVTFTAYASDYGPGVSRVDFYVDGGLVGTATSPPWQVAWGTSVNGAHAITAVATDMSGISVTSSAVPISISGGSSGGTPTCTVSLSPTSASWLAAGGSSTFVVTTQSGCQWAAQSTAAWIHTSSSGVGNDSVTYTVDANSSTTSRIGTLTIDGQTFIVSQDAVSGGAGGSGSDGSSGGAGSGGGSGAGASTSSCSVTVTPPAVYAVSAGQIVTFTVTAAAGCVWNTTSDVSWISMTPDTDVGSRTIAVAIDPAPNGNLRVGYVYVADQAVRVAQAESLNGLNVLLPDAVRPQGCTYYAIYQWVCVAYDPEYGCLWWDWVLVGFYKVCTPDRPSVSVDSADIETNEIKVTLRNTNAGTLTVRVSGPDGISYQTGQPTILGSGTHILHFDRNHLAEGTINHVQATWQTASGSAMGDLNIPAFNVLGWWHHTQYNRPDEGRCTDQPDDAGFLLGGACSAGTARYDFWRQTFLNGSGHSLSWGAVHTYPTCGSTLSQYIDPRSGKSMNGFRTYNIGSPDYDPNVYQGTVAADTKTTVLNKGDRVFLVDDDRGEAWTKMVNDFCPACQLNGRQIDNFTDDTACSKVLDLGTGYYQTIKLPR